MMNPQEAVRRSAQLLAVGVILPLAVVGGAWTTMSGDDLTGLGVLFVLTILGLGTATISLVVGLGLGVSAALGGSRVGGLLTAGHLLIGAGCLFLLHETRLSDDGPTDTGLVEDGCVEGDCAGEAAR